MTLQHFLRTMIVAIPGAAALAVATQAKAEGGEGSSILLPEQYEAAIAQEASSEAEAEVAALSTEAAAKSPERVEASPAARAGAEREGEIGEAAVELVPLPGKRKSKAGQADAARASALRPLIARHASENGIPYELADAVVRLESRYNAAARNGPNLGLTQVNFRTAQSLGYKGDASGLFDAETNLRFGLKYLAQAYRLAGGDTCGTILRYQFGHRTQTMTNASRVYCSKVKTILATAE